VLAKREHALAAAPGKDGPYFNGPELSRVDASCAPVFQRFPAVKAKLHRHGTAAAGLFPRAARSCRLARRHRRVLKAPARTRQPPPPGLCF